MGHVGHFQFLRIFHCQFLKKCFKKALEAFKVWAFKGITAGRKISKCVSEGKYGTCRAFEVFEDFPLPLFEKVLQKGFRSV